MPRKRPIQLVCKKATFNVEAWGRAVEALARQLQREWEQNGRPAKPDSPSPGKLGTQPESAT